MCPIPSRPATRKVPVNVTIDMGLLKSLDTLVAEAGVSRSEFIRQLIEDRLEDAALAEVASERMEAIQTGREDTFALDEIRQEFLR